MRHRIDKKKLNRDEGARRALKRSLALALIEKGQIETTMPKAKYARPFIERLLTHAKKGNLAAHRLVISRLGNKIEAAEKLKSEWAPKFQSVAGGYLRIVKLGPRKRDGAEMVRMSFAVPAGVSESEKRKTQNAK
jgi:large subunit ribosomal protein L17